MHRSYGIETYLFANGKHRDFSVCDIEVVFQYRTRHHGWHNDEGFPGQPSQRGI